MQRSPKQAEYGLDEFVSVAGRGGLRTACLRDSDRRAMCRPRLPDQWSRARTACKSVTQRL